MIRIDSAPYFIAGGLVLLILAGIWPAVPSVTGVAMIGCGATRYGRKRWESNTSGSLVCGAQFSVYASLVMLFAGSRLHSAAVAGVPLRFVDTLDFAGAAVLITLAAMATFRLPRGHQV